MEIYTLNFGKIMAELHQAEDLRQLTEKVREQNYFFTLLKNEINN